MKTKLAALIVALLSVCLFARPNAMAIGISIELGDRPYYDGPFYWEDGYQWVWIPGHWSEHHHEWIHGHYERRGEFHREYEHEHHRHHKDHDEHHEHEHDHDHDHH